MGNGLLGGEPSHANGWLNEDDDDDNDDDDLDVEGNLDDYDDENHDDDSIDGDRNDNWLVEGFSS